VLVVVLVLAAVTPLTAKRPRAQYWLLVADTVVLAALAVAMTVYVGAEDDYRHDGRSRWAVYDAEWVTAVAVVTAVGAAVLALLALRRRPLIWATPLAAFIAAGVNVAALAEMTN